MRESSCCDASASCLTCIVVFPLETFFTSSLTKNISLIKWILQTWTFCHYFLAVVAWHSDGSNMNWYRRLLSAFFVWHSVARKKLKWLRVGEARGDKNERVDGDSCADRYCPSMMSQCFTLFFYINLVPLNHWQTIPKAILPLHFKMTQWLLKKGLNELAI